jgi:hypothetical protein
MLQDIGIWFHLQHGGLITCAQFLAQLHLEPETTRYKVMVIRNKLALLSFRLSYNLREFR